MIFVVFPTIFCADDVGVLSREKRAKDFEADVSLV
jgi:hypothetical protein